MYGLVDRTKEAEHLGANFFPLTLILVSLSGNRITAKGGSRGDDLTKPFIDFALEHLGEIATRRRILGRGDLLGLTFGDDETSAFTALGTEIDHPICCLDDVEIVFDDHNSVAVVDEASENREELANVVEMKAGGRFVEDVDGVARRPLGQLGGQLHSLSLAAGQRRCRLAEPHVTEADIDQGLCRLMTG